MAQDLFRLVQDGSVTVIDLRLPMHLDSDEFNLLNDNILSVLAAQPDGRWVVDLSSLSYIGSSLLGLMVNSRQRIIEGGGKLALCGLSGPLMRIFTTCCLERLFVIRHTRPEAVRAAGS